MRARRSGDGVSAWTVLFVSDPSETRELSKARVGDVCAAKLRIESAEELQRRAAAPQPKKKAVFQPKPVKDDFLAKLRLHRKRYGW